MSLLIACLILLFNISLVSCSEEIALVDWMDISRSVSHFGRYFVGYFEDLLETNRIRLLNIICLIEAQVL